MIKKIALNTSMLRAIRPIGFHTNWLICAKERRFNEVHDSRNHYPNNLSTVQLMSQAFSCTVPLSQSENDSSR